MFRLRQVFIMWFTRCMLVARFATVLDRSVLSLSGVCCQKGGMTAGLIDSVDDWLTEWLDSLPHWTQLHQRGKVLCADPSLVRGSCTEVYPGRGETGPQDVPFEKDGQSEKRGNVEMSFGGWHTKEKVRCIGGKSNTIVGIVHMTWERFSSWTSVIAICS